MKKINIIGAGIAGLTCGIYALLNGFEAEIFEKHKLPGGECTGWQRGEYHFDNCIHWLIGSKKGTPINGLWRTIGALDDSIGIINNDVFSSYNTGSTIINIYRDLDRLGKHLVEVAPEDTKKIKELCKDARKFIKLGLPVSKPMDMFTKVDLFKLIFKMLPVAGVLKKYDNMTVHQYSNTFTNPHIKEFFKLIVPDHYKASALISTLALLHDGDAGWPVGGSLAFSKRIAGKFESLGGKINYNSEVSEAIIENNKSKGIILKNGSEHLSDYVIAAADGHFVVYNLLKGKYTDGTIDTLFNDRENYPIYSSVYISLGIEADLSKYPHVLHFPLEEPIDAGGIAHRNISLRHYCYEPGFAPQGSSAAISFMLADYDWWAEKRKDIKDYKVEKKNLAQKVISACENKFPEIKGKVREIDVATPVTYERYCNAYKGSWMSMSTTPGAKIRSISGILPGLKNFTSADNGLCHPEACL